MSIKRSSLPEYEDIVALPLGHDSPGEVAQPEGKVLDWSKGECEPIPGKTMPNLVHVKRDYSKIFEKYITSFLTFVNARATMRNEFWIIDCTILII